MTPQKKSKMGICIIGRRECAESVAERVVMAVFIDLMTMYML
jgi:hypothetical protein